MISGTAGGLRLKCLQGLETRPTADRVKESLFNIIAGKIEGCNVLDLFAGTGALGIEALSRGASCGVFVDNSGAAAGIIRTNLEHTGLSKISKVIVCDFDRFLQSTRDRFDIIFMDPPYKKGFERKALEIIEKNGVLGPQGLIVVESDGSDLPPAEIGLLVRTRLKEYGKAAISFYSYKDKPLNAQALVGEV